MERLSDEDGVSYAPDCGGKYDPGFHITYMKRGLIVVRDILATLPRTLFRSGHDSWINDSVGPVRVRQGLYLGNIEIRIGLDALVFPSSIINQNAGTRLQ